MLISDLYSDLKGKFSYYHKVSLQCPTLDIYKHWGVGYADNSVTNYAGTYNCQQLSTCPKLLTHV